MAASLAWLEAGCRQIMSLLPADQSLAAITFCAVVYGVICWLASKAVLSGMRFVRDRLKRGIPRIHPRTAS